MKVPIVGIPFMKIAIDLIGPIEPTSQRGYRWILTIVDYATRYPEAVALRNTDTEAIAEALLSLIARVGIPSCIVSDQGTQFVSKVMQDVSRLLSIQWIRSSPYHPQANGLVERFNAILKSMHAAQNLRGETKILGSLYRACALRIARRHSTVYSFLRSSCCTAEVYEGQWPFSGNWSGKKTDPETQSVYKYVANLHNKLEQSCTLASEHLMSAQDKQKLHFYVKAKQRTLDPGDLALLLLPTDNNKLLLHWKGPFRMLERIGIND